MKLQRDIYRTEQSRPVSVFEGDNCVTLSQRTQETTHFRVPRSDRGLSSGEHGYES